MKHYIQVSQDLMRALACKDGETKLSAHKPIDYQKTKELELSWFCAFPLYMAQLQHTHTGRTICESSIKIIFFVSCSEINLFDGSQTREWGAQARDLFFSFVFLLCTNIAGTPLEHFVNQKKISNA